MRGSAPPMLAFLLIALTSGGLTIAAAQSPHAPEALADGDGIYINGTNLGIIPGTAKSDTVSAFDRSGAREPGPGAIMFRSGGKLYIVDTPLRVPDLASSNPGRGPVQAKQQERTNRIRIDYVAPENPEQQAVYDMLRERGMLETVQKLFSPFRLPEDLTVRTQSCGMVNAWYEREHSRPTVTICYEYVQHIMQNSAMDETPWGVTRQDATCGQFLFVVAHEIGHAFFDIFTIPIFGREEDAADQFATYFMLQLGKSEARRLIIGAAYAYKDFIKGYKNNPKVLVPLASFSSNHGSPEERFYNLMCIAYGGEPALFMDVVDRGLLPKTRAQDCGYEFKTLRFAVHREIGPHLDRPASREVWNVPRVEDAVAAAAP